MIFPFYCSFVPSVPTLVVVDKRRLYPTASETLRNTHHHLRYNNRLRTQLKTTKTTTPLPRTQATNTASTMSSVAQKRLFHEYKNLSTNPPDGITAGPVTEDDMYHWEALIQGPEGTPFEGGIFAAELKFPKDYPLSPPTMKFVGGGVWHPNGILSSLYLSGIWIA